MKGERLVARVHAHPRLMVPKWTPVLYFGLPPAQPLRLALLDPTDRYSRAWKPVPPSRSLINYACFPASSSPSFSLFQRPPSPPSWRNEKSQPRSCSLEPNPNDYKSRFPPGEKDGDRDTERDNIGSQFGIEQQRRESKSDRRERVTGEQE